MNVLVTGCGGDIGLGIGRVLKDAFPQWNLYGSDLHGDHAGSFVFKQCITVPNATDLNYIDEMIKKIRVLKIDILIPVSEAEINIINSDNSITNNTSTKILMSEKNIIDIGLNKLETYLKLSENCVNMPWTVDANKSKPLRYPCIQKSKMGSGSKNIHILENDEDYLFYKKYALECIYQEYLYPDNEEYTCCLYADKSNGLRCFILKRELQGGFTGKGIVTSNAQILDYLRDFYKKIPFYGSINVQLRLTDKGPLLFEINPRFSSTVVFRHKLGFNDLVWSINDLLGRPNPEYHEKNIGVRIYRGSSEYILGINNE